MLPYYQYQQDIKAPNIFRVVMSVTISAYKRCSVRLYPQSFVGGFVSYLQYLYWFAYSGVQHISLCFCLFYLRLMFCVPNVTSFSVLAVFDCPFCILYRLYIYSLFICQY
jgi:hypothetical protein